MVRFRQGLQKGLDISKIIRTFANMSKKSREQITKERIAAGVKVSSREVKSWDDFLVGVKGHVKEHIADLYRCCDKTILNEKSNDSEESKTGL